jgi:tetratricopeptide (TPR) repeat protein
MRLAAVQVLLNPILTAITLAFLLHSSNSAAHPELLTQIDSVTTELLHEPKNPILYLRRAQLHGMHADVPSALADLQRAQDLGSTTSDILLVRGQMYLDNTQLDRALADLDELVQHYPQIADGHLARGTLLTRVNRLSEASDELTSAIELTTEPVPELFIAQADAIHRAHGAAPAIRALDSAIARIGSLTSLQLMAAKLEESSGQTTAAAARLTALARASARKEPHLLLLAELYNRTGHTTQSMEAASHGLAAIEALPARAQARVATRRIYDRLLQLRNNAPARYINDAQPPASLEGTDAAPQP